MTQNEKRELASLTKKILRQDHKMTSRQIKRAIDLQYQANCEARGEADHA